MRYYTSTYGLTPILYGDQKVSFFIQSLKNIEVNTVRDLHNVTQNRLFTYDEFIIIHGNIVDFVTFFGLTMAIPHKWKELIQGNLQENVAVTPGIVRLLSFSATSKQVYYWIRSHRKDPYINTVEKWSEELRSEVERENWELQYKMTMAISLSTKLRLSQCKVRNRALVTNICLSKWNDVVSDLCYDCNRERETISHLLYSCRIVSNFWLKVKR